MGSGRPYYITKEVVRDIQVQVPPTLIDAMTSYMKAAQEGAKTLQEGARAVDASAKAGSSVVDFMKQAAPIAGVGIGGAALGAYAIAPETTSNFVSKLATNVVVGTAKTVGKAAISATEQTAKAAGGAMVSAAKGAVETTAIAAKDLVQVSANHLPGPREALNAGTGAALLAWVLHVMSGGNTPLPAIVPP